MAIKKNIIIALIETINEINNDIENKYVLPKTDIYFHAILTYVYRGSLDNNLIITEQDFNHLYDIILHHTWICYMKHKTNIITLWNYGISHFWYVRIKNLYFQKYNINYPSQCLVFENNDICSNCHQPVLNNVVVKEIKEKFIDIILNTYLNNQDDYLNCINNKNERIYIFDGGNIGYNHNKSNDGSNKKQLDVTRIKIALKQSVWHNSPKILILNIKHKEIIKDRLNNIPYITIIYSKKGIDDDLLGIYYWLSNNNCYLITNDMYHNYSHTFQENQYLSYSWNKLMEIQKISFQFIHKNGKLIFKYDMPKLFINWSYKCGFYHIPIEDEKYYYCVKA
jgi:hypothetical protein